VRVTLPVKPPLGVTVIVEALPVVAPGARLTAVPVMVKVGPAGATVTDAKPMASTLPLAASSK